MQAVIGSCSFDDIACKVATTVIDHKPERNTLIVDAGFAAMSSDGLAPRPTIPATLGMAPIQGHPELRYILVSWQFLTDLNWMKFPTTFILTSPFSL